jgi:hypothetical protein
MKRSTVQCLHVMTTHGEEFWHPLLETGFQKENSILNYFNFFLFCLKMVLNDLSHYLK